VIVCVLKSCIVDKHMSGIPITYVCGGEIYNVPLSVINFLFVIGWRNLL